MTKDYVFRFFLILARFSTGWKVIHTQNPTQTLSRLRQEIERINFPFSMCDLRIYYLANPRTNDNSFDILLAVIFRIAHYTWG
jgi:hypothetical protein